MHANKVWPVYSCFHCLNLLLYFGSIMSYDIGGLLDTQRMGLCLPPWQKCRWGILRGPVSQDWYSVDP